MKKILLLLLFSLVLLPSLAEAQFPDSLKQYFWRRDGKWAIPSATDTSGQFIWRTFGGLNQSDSIIFYDTTGLAWHRDGHKLTAIVTPDTSRLFLWSISGGVTRKDSIRFYDTTGIHWVNNGHGLTAVLSVTATPASPDSAVQYDSVGVFGANGNFVYERRNRVLSVIGTPSGTRVNANGMFMGTALQGGVSNNNFLRILSNAANGNNRGTVRFGANDDIFFDDQNSLNAGNVAVFGLAYGTGGYNNTYHYNVITNNQNTIHGVLHKRFDDNVNFFEHIDFGRARGVAGASTKVLNGTVLGEITFGGDVNTASLSHQAAVIKSFAVEDYSTTTSPGVLEFFTTPREGVTPIHRGYFTEFGKLNWGLNDTHHAQIDSNGNISSTDSIAGSTIDNSFGRVQPYKVYVALLSQIGTSAFVIEEVNQSTLGATVSSTRTSAGVYSFTSTAWNTLNKTEVFFTIANNSTAQQSQAGFDNNTSDVMVRTFSGVGVAADVGTNGDNYCTIEIRVYP